MLGLTLLFRWAIWPIGLLSLFNNPRGEVLLFFMQDMDLLFFWGGGVEGGGSTFYVECCLLWKVWVTTSFRVIVTDLLLRASVGSIPVYKPRDKTCTVITYTFTNLNMNLWFITIQLHVVYILIAVLFL